MAADSRHTPPAHLEASKPEPRPSYVRVTSSRIRAKSGVWHPSNAFGLVLALEGRKGRTKAIYCGHGGDTWLCLDCAQAIVEGRRLPGKPCPKHSGPKPKNELCEWPGCPQNPDNLPVDKQANSVDNPVNNLSKSGEKGAKECREGCNLVHPYFNVTFYLKRLKHFILCKFSSFLQGCTGLPPQYTYLQYLNSRALLLKGLFSRKTTPKTPRKINFEVLEQFGFTSAQLKKLDREGAVKIHYERVWNRFSGTSRTRRMVEVKREIAREDGAFIKPMFMEDKKPRRKK